MLRKLLLCSILFSFCSGYSQDSIASFSQILKSNSIEYIAKSNQAYAKNNTEEGKQLFDSLIHNKLIGTRFDNLELNTFSSKKISTDQIDKPLLIITYASWCVINKGDIPALNQLAEKHNDDLTILVLFWGNKTETKKIAKLFRKNIQVAYTDFNKNEDYNFINQLKNTLGFPTSYLIDADKKVVSINRVDSPYFLNISSETAVTNSYNQFSSVINEAFIHHQYNIAISQ